MSGRVLLVAYFFPPVAGVPVPRVMSLVRNLPRHGWETIVLTPRNAGHPVRDEAAANRIPVNTVVVRTKIIEPGQLRRWLAGRSDGEASPDGDGEVDAGQRSGTAHRLRHSASAWLLSTIGSFGRLVLFPDEQVGWVPFALASGFRAMRRERVDVVWSTSSPVSAHVIAGVLATITRRPWVADFRDPWVSATRAHKRPRFQRWLMARLEAWILRQADRVTFATPRLTRQYANRYPTLKGRFVTFLNGYDRAEIDEVLAEANAAPLRRRSLPFRLAYTGTPEARVLETFFAGVALAIERGSPRSDEIRIEFIGAENVECIALLEAWSRHPGREGLIRRRPFLPRAGVLRMLSGADAALVLLGDYPGSDLLIPVKVFEAIGLDRPVLAMTPPGDLRDVLESLGWGIVVEPHPEAVAEGLKRLVASPPAARQVDPDGRYDRARLVEELARIMDEVRGERRHSGTDRP